MATINSNKLQPNAFMKCLFIFCLITLGLDSESRCSSTQMSPKELVNTVASQAGTDEKGAKQVIHSWNRASDPAAIKELVDSYNSHDKHSSHALNVIIRELPIKAEDKARALASLMANEKDTGKTVHLMGLLMKSDLEAPKTLPSVALPALAKMLRAYP